MTETVSLVYLPALCYQPKGKNHIRKFGAVLQLIGGIPVTINESTLEQLREYRTFQNLENCGAISVRATDSHAAEKQEFLQEKAKKGEKLNIDEMQAFIETMEDLDQLQKLKASDPRKTVKEAAQRRIETVLAFGDKF